MMAQIQKVALVTGGSRGIGLAAVKRLKAAGFQVVSCSSGQVSERVSDLHLTCDVSDVDQVKATLRRVVEQFGRIDVLINNAGTSGTTAMDPESDDRGWQHVLDVNVNGTFFFSKYALPFMPEGGRIINVGSVLSFRGVPDGIAYATAKHAVVGLTRSLAHFAAPKKITVNVICPGWTRTEMAMGRMQEMGWTEEDLKKSVPLGRFSEPEEIAEWMYFLTTEKAQGMTGQTLTVDSGWLA